MRKFSCFLVVVVFMLLMAAGCSSNPNSEITNEEQIEATTSEDTIADFSSGSEEVINSLQVLKTDTETEPANAKQIQTTGKDLEENWDAIEEQVEQLHPEDYKNIEESLYPLIDETKKDQPNVEKIQQLINETTEKMKAFKEKTASS